MDGRMSLCNECGYSSWRWSVAFDLIVSIFTHNSDAVGIKDLYLAQFWANNLASVISWLLPSRLSQLLLMLLLLHLAHDWAAHTGLYSLAARSLHLAQRLKHLIKVSGYFPLIIVCDSTALVCLQSVRYSYWKTGKRAAIKAILG